MLRSYMQSLLNSVDGCQAILVYDSKKDSSPIFRVGDLPESETNAIKQNINIFSSSIERTAKLCKTNSSKTIMAFYNHHQIYIFSKATIVFIIVASSETNAGMILNLRNYLEPMVTELTSTGQLNDALSSSVGSNTAQTLNQPSPFQSIRK
jgi:hypothetical protein